MVKGGIDDPRLDAFGDARPQYRLPCPTLHAEPVTVAHTAFLGIVEDPRCQDAAAAAAEWAQDRRCLTDPSQLWESARVRQGTVLYASILYQARATPAGLAGYDEFGGGSTVAGDAIWRARELVGQDAVVA